MRRAVERSGSAGVTASSLATALGIELDAAEQHLSDLQQFGFVAYRSRLVGGQLLLEGIRRDRYANPRTQMERIVRRAGIEPWPKLFHNCRAGRETELCDHFPEHLVLAWLGNTKRVARRHYLRPTDQHFARAAATPTSGHPPKSVAQSVAPFGDQALQYPLQPDDAPRGQSLPSSYKAAADLDLNAADGSNLSASVIESRDDQYPGRDSNPRPPV